MGQGQNNLTRRCRGAKRYIRGARAQAANRVRRRDGLVQHLFALHPRDAERGALVGNGVGGGGGGGGVPNPRHRLP